MITSLRSKIRLVFSLTLLLLTALFLFSIKYDHSKIKERNLAHEQEVVHYLYSYFLKYGKIDFAYLESQNLSLITDKGMVVQIEGFFKEEGKLKHYSVGTYRLKRILIINNDRFKVILENKNRVPFPIKRLLLFATVFLLIIFLYLWIMRSLKPLTTLKQEIKTFSEGNLNIACRSDKKDEIAEVANEFDHAVAMIRKLLESRQLFLRAIMHELKTPIAKGRFIAEMIESETHKKRIHTIFEKLNLLIDEFAKIEKITSNNFKLKRKPYRLSDLVDASVDMLMMDNPQKFITIENQEDITLEVDFELFTLMIKNLLDNGLKYSSDRAILVIISQEGLEIMNLGERLNEPLENYFETLPQLPKGVRIGTLYRQEHS
jgi:two-component system OmpR family sensor kinase